MGDNDIEALERLAALLESELDADEDGDGGDEPDKPVVKVVAATLLLLVVTCVSLRPPPAVEIAGDATNRITPVLVAIETAQGEEAISRGEDPAITVAPRWAPFWSVWKSWCAAQRAWASAYELGTVGQQQDDARTAFCKAFSALPTDVPRDALLGTGIECMDGGVQP